MITHEVDRLTVVLNRMPAPVHYSDLKTCNVHELLDHCSLLLKSQYPKIELTNDYDLGLPQVQGDKTQLIQVFLNIIKNAAQVQNGEGAITLQTRAAQPDTSRLQMPGLGSCVSIFDHGPGIEPSSHDQLLTPCFSQRPNGTGLGLAIAQEITWVHKGFIDATNHEQGAVFNVYLPLGEQHG